MSTVFTSVTSDGNVHVLPEDDLMAHELSEECPCGPTTELVREDDGSVAALIAHPSLDGREIDGASEVDSPNRGMIDW